MNISNDIIKNYLVKNVVYKLSSRIIEIQINQNNLLVSFNKVAKQFDRLNLLKIRKGYEKDNICYFTLIENFEDCNYVIEIIKKMYEYIMTPKESMSDKLVNILKPKILSLSDNISFHHINKGIIFKDKRNFVLLGKTNYGLYIKILNVDNKENILNIVTRKNYEPLCLSYKLTKESDIDIIFPYIEASYSLNKINPCDVKENYKYYFSASS